MLEADLRDLLATQIELLEEGLELLDIEAYIPSKLGTRSFIDLLAKDRNDRWVLIELKRSDAAARQAIHEIYKYVEAVKAHLEAREEELRAFIVSTEWRELLVPFSRFVNDTSINVTGAVLKVDDTSNSLTKELVEPVPYSVGRVLSPWHEVSLYKNQERLAEGIKSFDVCCSVKGVENYLLIVLKAPNDFYEKSVYSTAVSLAQIRGETSISEDILSDTRATMDRMDYMIYFVPQLLSAERYLEIIERSSNPSDEAQALYADDNLSDEEKLLFLHEMAYDVDPKPSRDYLEIGNPAKFKNKLLENEGWMIEAIHRRGAFERNHLLTDTTLLNEVQGEDGVSGQRVKRRVLLSNKADLESVKQALNECLLNNQVWRKGIYFQLDEARSDFPNGSVEVSVFSPSTGVFTIFFAVMKGDGLLYVPTYSLFVSDENGDVKRAYVGELIPVDDEPKGAVAFSNVLNCYYSGDLGGLLMTSTWGGYEARDFDILESLGLTYSSFRCDLEGDSRRFYHLVNFRWKEVPSIKPFSGIKKFCEDNEELVRVIARKIGPRYGPICEGGSAVKILQKHIDENLAAQHKQRFLNPPEVCDVCGMPFSEEALMVDGLLIEPSIAATMCGDCSLFFGQGVGWGKGQLYRKETDGRWLQVGGFGPDEDVIS